MLNHNKSDVPQFLIDTAKNELEIELAGLHIATLHPKVLQDTFGERIEGSPANVFIECPKPATTV